MAVGGETTSTVAAIGVLVTALATPVVQWWRARRRDRVDVVAAWQTTYRELLEEMASAHTEIRLLRSEVARLQRLMTAAGLCDPGS